MSNKIEHLDIKDDDKQVLSRKKILMHIVIIILILFIFLLSIDLLSSSFTKLSKNTVHSIISLTANPFISLFIGLLITAIFQSSSTSTSMIVAVVASGSIGLTNAIPMIMGANIGTTLTSTIVSLAFIAKKKEFRKAISAGVVHDLFNILVTLILFPLEYYFKFLSSLTNYFTSVISPSANGQSINDLQLEVFFTSEITELILKIIDNPFVIITIAFFMLFGAIKLLSNQLYGLLRGEFGERLNQHLKSPITSFTWGTLLTAAIQSSSITTSLIVPVVATGKISLRKAFPFIMGANIGTTITAFLAAILKSNLAINIAIAHLLFNLIGVLIFLPFGGLRKIPALIAREIGKMTIKYRLIGLIYIILTFFLIPFLLIYFNQ